MAALVVMSAITAWKVMNDKHRFSPFEAAVLPFAIRFEAPEIQAEELINRLIQAEPTLILDVREKAEQNVSVIPGAVLLRTDEPIESRKEYTDFLEKKEKNALIVVYCAAGFRSAKSLSELKVKPVIPMRSLHGGIIAYVNAGGWVTDPSGRSVNRIHAYSNFWKTFVNSETEAVTDPPAEK